MSKQVATCDSGLPEIASPHQRAFLAAFGETGNIRLACMIAKVGRSSHYRWMDESPSYRDAFEVAREDSADLLEAEARRRAVEGVEKPTGWHQGKPGGYVREYSDLLLIFLLKGARPETYKDRVDTRQVTAHVNFGTLSDDQIRRVAAGEELGSVLAGAVAEHARLTAAVEGDTSDEGKMSATPPTSRPNAPVSSN
jgi:hypothetical protein